MATLTRGVTADELLRDCADRRCELIRGEVVDMSPAGLLHGEVVAEVNFRLQGFVKGQHLGKVYANDSGFRLARQPDTVRAPDVAFLRSARVPSGSPAGYFDGAPDLAIEIVSPSDASTAVAEKVAMWLHAGCRAVWTIDPQRRAGTAHRLVEGRVTSVEVDVLAEPETLPGFALPLAEVWASIDAVSPPPELGTA